MILRSGILTTLHEHALTPRIPRFTRSDPIQKGYASMDSSMNTFRIVKAFCPAVPTSTLDCEFIVQTFASCWMFVGLKHRVLTSDHEDTVALGMKHVRYTFRLMALLLLAPCLSLVVEFAARRKTKRSKAETP